MGTVRVASLIWSQLQSLAAGLRGWSQAVPLWVLLAIDGFIVVLQIVDPDPARAWSLYIEHGYPEFYGYGKTVAAALVLLLAYRAAREPPYRGVALVLVVISLDDAFALHETVGRWLAEGTTFDAPFGLRPSDIGELAALS